MKSNWKTIRQQFMYYWETTRLASSLGKVYDILM